MNKKGAKLISREEFYSRFRKHKDLVVGLEQYSVAQLGEPDVIDRIWRAISLLGLSATGTQVVAGAKALHHLLPNLLPPIDRRYTWKFFKVYDSSFRTNGKGQYPSAVNRREMLSQINKLVNSDMEATSRAMNELLLLKELIPPPVGIERILSGFSRIYQSVEDEHDEGYLSSLVCKTPWATSETKLIDNAIIGFVKYQERKLAAETANW